MGIKCGKLQYNAKSGGSVLICVIYLIFKNLPFSDGGGYFLVILSAASLQARIINPILLDSTNESTLIKYPIVERIKLLMSKIELLDSLDKSKNILDWHESNILGKEFSNNYYNYYFPVYSDDSHDYLCVYLRKKIKDNIVKSSTILGYDLRYLSIDIFSAAIGARQVFYNEINSEYLIWKICNKNLHRLALYNGNKLNAYIEIYRKNSKFIPKQYVGSEENKTLLINCVNEILINKSNFHRFNNIYVYQTKQNKSDINRIIDLNFKNIKILNFNKMIDQTKEYNPLKYIPFVENGIVFKGIDI